ncbi:PhzF family phenazine biosynthesis isomerase [Marinicrinis lubricantis]|uniref:PhzF family phenazine biosynthesis isomerase n=1 Tax=Marinicrinis lubricantis TaxID=2086470 RepID=A0ABW1IUH1_9BACL
MKSIEVAHYDAFSLIPNKGNPAGVVFHADELSEEEMLHVAAQVGFNETAFIVKSNVADIRLRYFTPGHEMNLCGHATMASIYGMYDKGMLDGRSALTIETKAGILPIHISRGADEEILMTMKQAAPQFVPFEGSSADLALSMGLASEDLDDNLPIVYGSTGTWTLLVPIRKLEVFQRMKPNQSQFPMLLKEMPRASVHPFCLETYDPKAHMHARHFSSPYSGTVEDPVTGTASGVMGAYYSKYIRQATDAELNLIVEQGMEIGRDGRVHVKVIQVEEQAEVYMTGTAVYVDQFEVQI